MFSKETFIHDAELEIIVPNSADDTLDFNEKNIDNIINAQQRTQIYYDELVHIYLMTTLPPESNFENKEEATEFFKNLEVKLQATLIDAPNLSNLTVPSNNYTSELERTSSSSSTASSVSGVFSCSTSISSNATSIFTHGSPTGDYSIKRLSSKVIEGTIIHSANYDSKNNDKMVVVERDDCWICVLKLEFPIENIRARAQNQIALDVTVTQSRRKIVDSAKSDLYSPEHFGINLLGGLIDDPAFESLNFSIPTPQLTKKEKTSIYSNLPSTIKRCSRKIISVRPTLNARIRSTYVSPSEKTVMMSVELENDTENDMTFSIEHLKVEIDHGFVTECAWGLQDTSNFPITLRPFDQVNFLYNVTILEDSSFPEPSNTQQYYPTPAPHSSVSSRRESIASINSTLNTSSVENKQRTLSVIVSGCPIIDGVKSHCIESKWDCELDISTLFDGDSMASSQLREMESNKFIPMMYNSKFNFGIREEINAIDKTATIRDSFNSNDVKSYDTVKCGNDSSDVELEINVNGVDIANKKQHSGYIPETNLINDENNGILPYGRLPKLQKRTNLESNVSDGVFVNFEVCGKPVVGKVFTVKMFIVNRSENARRFTITVPSKKGSNERLFNNHRLTHKPSLSQSSDITLVEYNNSNYGYFKQSLDPFMDEPVFLGKHLESVIPEADLICLDNDVRIGPINPHSSESATLHFISTKEALHLIELVQLVDDDTGFITNLRNVIQVNVAKNENEFMTNLGNVIQSNVAKNENGFMTSLGNIIQSNVAKNERRMKRMNWTYHNSFFSRHIEVAS
ncbi:hypothetical protein RclHR1_05120014 [Rhizophagus clarus]|uniref:TRAPP trafficking subunit Trs65-domain-containing protein n=1 Tax=Rhizophagus clarus TaxID=94130 RepID=A0A2Z6RM25_9GLOM|nr:hypothetical protein RclHR1_05120014 [Rhizophagus clarus]GES79755.1 TRAPP trafficking subunit Trs65-domain-containing protein [Rhizophagus clarus]